MSESARMTFDRFMLFQEEVERLFRQLFHEVEGGTLPEGVLLPAADVFESEGEIRIEVELPGLKRSEVRAYVTGNTLWIEGRKRDDVRDHQVQFHCMERRFGLLRRAIDLPRSCNTASVRATFQNGVLKLRFKKVEERRGARREIEIREGET